MTGGYISASIWSAHVIAAVVRRRRVDAGAAQLGAAHRLGRTAEPVHLHHPVAVGPVTGESNHNQTVSRASVAHGHNRAGSARGHVPAVEHPELAHVGVDVSVGGAHRVARLIVAVGRTLGDGALFRNAIRYGDLEHVTPSLPPNLQKKNIRNIYIR